MPRNLQVVATGTTHPCRQCGQVFTVAKNPNQSGLFCSRACALKFSRSKIRTFEQRQADHAQMIAGIRERQERDRAESAKRHAEDLARQHQMIEENRIANEAAEKSMAERERRTAELEYDKERRELAEDLLEIELQSRINDAQNFDPDEELLARYNDERRRIRRASSNGER